LSGGFAGFKVSNKTHPNHLGANKVQLVHQSKPAVMRDRLIRLPDVENLIGCKKSTIYTMIKQDNFPRPLRLSARMVVWPETTVLQWMQNRINESGQP
jgi:prophage regulatory protein